MCIMNNNRADYGGAICNFAKSGNCSPIIRDSKIRNNSAQYDGGFIKNIKKYGAINPKIKDTFQENNRDNLPDDNFEMSMRL